MATSCFTKGVLSGCFSLDMIQNRDTGICRLQVGSTEADWKVNKNFDSYRYSEDLLLPEDSGVEFKLMRSGWRRNQEVPEGIRDEPMGCVGTFTKTESGERSFQPGIPASFTEFCNSRVTHEISVLRTSDSRLGSRIRMVPWLTDHCWKHRLSIDSVVSWEREQGGILKSYHSVAALEGMNMDDMNAFIRDHEIDMDQSMLEADIKLKLYTTMSAHHADRENDLVWEMGMSPDWEQLEGIVAARNPKKSPAWVKNAVQQYM